MATTDSSAFLADLEKYHVLNGSQAREARKLTEPNGLDPRKLAAELISRGWLTAFQANQLFQGRGDALVLGPYVLLERVGQGGMGQVFKARHAMMDRVVALKVIRAELLEDASALARFQREVQAAAKLSHPNVVMAHDADKAGESYFLVMEFIEGTDLGRLVQKRGRLSPGEAANYIRQAALGLQHAFQRGLVHRDIKPANLMLASEGNVVKVLDLGLARIHAFSSAEATGLPLTNHGVMMGTPDYLAPEQAIDSHAADIRADIYSLGCTLYHLLSGRAPFAEGSVAQKLLKHQQGEPESVESRCPEAPAALAAVVRRMMAKRPEDRYQTPQEVADALTPFVSMASLPAITAQAPSPAPPPATTVWPSSPLPVTVTDPARIRARPGRKLLFIGGVAAMVMLGGCLIVGLVAMLASPRGRIPIVAAKEMDARDNPAAPDKGEEPVQPINPVKPINPEPKGEEPKNREPETLAPLLPNQPARLVKELKGHAGMILAMAFSPDGQRLATCGDDNQLLLWDARSGESIGKPLRHSAPVRAAAWSPDGKRLASASWTIGADAVVKLWNPDEGKEDPVPGWKERTGTPSRAEIRCLVFSPNGKRLAASGSGPVLVWDLEKGTEPVVFEWQKTFPSYAYSASFARDGRTLAAGCHEMGDSVLVWDVAAPGEPIVLRGNKQAFGISHSDVRAVVAFVAGDKMLVRVTSDGLGGIPGSGKASLLIFDADVEKQRYTLKDRHALPGGAAFALVSAADGHLRAAIARGTPDIAYEKDHPPGDVQLWDSRTDKAIAFSPGHKQSVSALAFSANGTRLATGSVDQTVRLWELRR